MIPFYNSGWSIERTLRSVFAQSYSDMEVILVDDGSPKDPAPLVEPFADRLRIVRQENRGLAAARNRGIAESRGEFVAPIDADDLWHPDYLAAMVRALDASPGAPFAYSDYHRVDENDWLIPSPQLAARPDHDFAGLISLNSVGSGSAATFRKRALLAQKGYDETLRGRSAQGAEDWKLIVQLAATGMPVSDPRRLVAYRLTRVSMSRSRPDRQFAAIEAVIGDLRQEFPDVPERLFRDAVTMMIAWLLPAFLTQRMFAAALRHAIRAYAFNPFWWRNRNIRLIHGARLRMAFAALFGRSTPRRRLADLEEGGERPFSFLLR